MKFRVYLRRDNRLLELYRIKRTQAGLYFNPVRNPMNTGGSGSSSYHEDGRSWEKFMGSRDSRKVLNPPLSSFSGALTLRAGVSIISSMGWNSWPEDQVSIRPEDVVVERAGVFGVEIILSDKVLDLPALPDRPNSVTYVKDQVFPVIIIEVFDLPSSTIQPFRFKRAVPLVEGENLFFDHHGNI